MQFGIFTIVPYHEDFTPPQAFNDALEQIAFADEAGLDEAWLGEHRFSRHGLLSGIWSFLGAVAGAPKTSASALRSSSCPCTIPSWWPRKWPCWT